MTDIRATLRSVSLENPTVLPAGILGITAASLKRVAASGAGAVTTKSIGPQRREGHKNPVVVEVNGGLLNSVGLSCPSLEESIEELTSAVKESRVPVIASFYGRSIDEFGLVAAQVSKAKPDFIEANISCPNIEDEYGKPFGTDHRFAAAVTEKVKDSSKIPLIVKLTPNVPDIKVIAAAVEEAGADCISAINTLGPGMLIDLSSGKPVLSNRFGGMSGPAVLPVAVRCVYEIYDTVDVPIIGMGGIQSGLDAVQMLMAGASAVGIGTAVWKRGPEVFNVVSGELTRFMQVNGYRSLKDLIGRAHQ